MYSIEIVLLLGMVVLASGQSTTGQSSQSKDTCTEVDQTLEYVSQSVQDMRQELRAVAGKLQAQQVLPERKQDPNATCESLMISDTESVFFGLAFTHELLRSNYLVVFENNTWQGARQACLDRGYYLLYIESRLENMYIAHMLEQYRFKYGSIYIWMDGTDAGHEGCWVWTAPQMKRFTDGYQKWMSGQPNNYNQQHCAGLHLTRDAQWHDDQCTGQRYYMCKRRIGEHVTSIVSQGTFNSTALCS